MDSTRAKPLTAVIWDYDGTLVDTRAKNLSVTRRLIETVSRHAVADLPVLASVDTYEAALLKVRNWREFYQDYLLMSAEETDEAGLLWASYQESDTTPVHVFEGIPQVLGELRRVPHGVFSLNSRDNILAALEEVNLATHFDSVVGYEQVPFSRQKPEPDGLVLCLEELTGLAPGAVLFIGDHEMDALSAANANRHFESEGVDIRVLSVGVDFRTGELPTDWPVTPDFLVARPAEILDLVENWNGRSEAGG
jgi:phosphoglycolate phosphatase-like HAD superfamily hydrolase